MTAMVTETDKVTTIAADWISHGMCYAQNAFKFVVIVILFHAPPVLNPPPLPPAHRFSRGGNNSCLCDPLDSDYFNGDELLFHTQKRYYLYQKRGPRGVLMISVDNAIKDVKTNS